MINGTYHTACGPSGCMQDTVYGSPKLDLDAPRLLQLIILVCCLSFTSEEWQPS